MEEYKLDEGPLITMYGWVVAVNPLGQMLFSPLLGFISDRVGSVRLACIVGSVAYVVGNGLYSILSVFPEGSR